jgi:DNA-binding MarR family transcriptional regulator
MKTGIIDNIIYLSEKCINESSDLCAAAGLSRQEANILISLEQDERVTSNEVSRRIGLSPSRVSRIVDNLIDKGYLKRKMSSGDRRAIEISLSFSGRKCREKITAGKELCELRLKKRLSDRERKTVDRALALLLKVFEEENAKESIKN